MREWCEDWYTPNEFRLVRGSAWGDFDASRVRCAFRGGDGPVLVLDGVGFRVVRAARASR